MVLESWEAHSRKAGRKVKKASRMAPRILENL
jgi:hypothetical protein